MSTKPANRAGGRRPACYSFFATLLPRTAALAAITAIDASGQALKPQDRASHELAWQRFQRRTGRS